MSRWLSVASQTQWKSICFSDCIRFMQQTFSMGMLSPFTSSSPEARCLGLAWWRGVCRMKNALVVSALTFAGKANVTRLALSFLELNARQVWTPSREDLFSVTEYGPQGQRVRIILMDVRCLQDRSDRSWTGVGLKGIDDVDKDKTINHDWWLCIKMTKGFIYDSCCCSVGMESTTLRGTNIIVVKRWKGWLQGWLAEWIWLKYDKADGMKRCKMMAMVIAPKDISDLTFKTKLRSKSSDFRSGTFSAAPVSLRPSGKKERFLSSDGPSHATWLFSQHCWEYSRMISSSSLPALHWTNWFVMCWGNGGCFTTPLNPFHYCSTLTISTTGDPISATN